MRWGRLALFCAHHPLICRAFLTVRFYWYARIVKTSSVIKRRRSRCAIVLFFFQQSKWSNPMTEILMKIMMGGWIPQGKRSQMLAAAAALGAILTSIVQWGSGDMSGMDLVHLIQDKWQILFAAYAVYFVAEKIDAKK